MDKLYAPWRDQYVMSQVNKGQVKACVFCTVFDGKEADQDRYILYKDLDVVVLLNLYPYNAGHLLIVPVKHVPELYDLADIVLLKMMKLSAISTQVVKQALACEATNFGANLGKIAGGGIPEHVHLHVVPRFLGDTGFFTVVGNAKQISVDLNTVYKKLQPHFQNISL